MAYDYNINMGKVDWINNFSKTCPADQCFHFGNSKIATIFFLLNNIIVKTDIIIQDIEGSNLNGSKIADEFSELLIKELKEKCCGKVEPIKDDKQQPPSTSAEKPKTAESKPAETVPQEKKAQDNKSPDSKSQPTKPPEKKKK